MAVISGRGGDDARREEIGRLVEMARPTIASVIARFTRSGGGTVAQEDVQDVMSTVSLRLLRRLQDDVRIDDLESYVATLTYRTIYDLLRERFPERTRLKNRLRYLLRHDARFALWSGNDGTLCGLRRWEGRSDALDTFTIAPDMATPVMLDRGRPHDAVAAVLERAARPLQLETLVAVMATLWNILEVRQSADVDVIQSHSPSPAARLETRQLLASLWNEIRLLPQSQRTALLLGLRDAEGVGAVALITFLGVARGDEIAEVAGVTADELAAMWADLPLDDFTIAERLGVTRQQVINLRRAARERLARRTLPFSRYDRRSR